MPRTGPARSRAGSFCWRCWWITSARAAAPPGGGTGDPRPPQSDAFAPPPHAPVTDTHAPPPAATSKNVRERLSVLARAAARGAADRADGRGGAGRSGVRPAGRAAHTLDARVGARAARAADDVYHRDRRD